MCTFAFVETIIFSFFWGESRQNFQGRLCRKDFVRGPEIWSFPPWSEQVWQERKSINLFNLGAGHCKLLGQVPVLELHQVQQEVLTQIQLLQLRQISKLDIYLSFPCSYVSFAYFGQLLIFTTFQPTLVNFLHAMIFTSMSALSSFFKSSCFWAKRFIIVYCYPNIPAPAQKATFVCQLQVGWTARECWSDRWWGNPQRIAPCPSWHLY